MKWSSSIWDQEVVLKELKLHKIGLKKIPSDGELELNVLKSQMSYGIEGLVVDGVLCRM